jgi:hypothetical protein
MFVVERDGRIVGLGGRAFPAIRVAGHVYRGLYSHRLRLLPEAQGEGVLGPLNAVRMLSQAARHCLSYAFIAAGNEAAIRSMPGGVGGEGFWPVGAARLIIDTATVAASPNGRPAQESDVARLVELFNFTHRNEELFVPYTEETLAMRMHRAPDLYSWRNVLIGDRAALGVWPAGLGVRRDADGVETNDVRALVLDYGCESEDALVELIGAAAGGLRSQGTTELSIFCSGPSPLFPALSRLSKRIEPYLVRCAVAPGHELEQRGVYVDQLYF